ncbi:MAG: UDP-N-acetylmuramate dehydrogenase [Deltaproteobacteria bacterium]|nr:UDP-N-acetylmuramate dehydrogenase [Deltaproteobacteria bacterium]
MRAAGGRIEEVFGAKLRDFTTVGIGGAAERMVFPRSLQEIQEILRSERQHGREVRFLGAGSNLLVNDGGIRGTVMCLKKNMGKMIFSPGGAVVAEGGTMLPRFSVLCALSGLSGAEELAGIPGTVGGAISMNAGAYGRSIGELAEWVEIVDMDGRLVRLDSRDIHFGYREANFPMRGIISRVAFRLAFGNSDESFDRIRIYNEKRRATQPWGARTFGSTFRNPRGGEKAARLLDQAGMKGAREGDALFSEKHANFMINAGQASAAEAMRLIDRARQTVRATAGVELALEVKLWGVFDA